MFERQINRGFPHGRRTLRRVGRAGIYAVLGLVMTILTAWGLELSAGIGRAHTHEVAWHSDTTSWFGYSRVARGYTRRVLEPGYVLVRSPGPTSITDRLEIPTASNLPHPIWRWGLEPEIGREFFDITRHTDFSDGSQESRVPMGGRYWNESAAGFPMLCVWKAQHRGGPMIGAISLPDPIGAMYWLAVPFRPELPFLPIWPGLVVNTLFYGGLLFGLVTLQRAWRHRHRRRRGLCAECAYDLSGGAHVFCPECGSQNAKRAGPRPARKQVSILRTRARQVVRSFRICALIGLCASVIIAWTLELLGGLNPLPPRELLCGRPNSGGTRWRIDEARRIGRVVRTNEPGWQQVDFSFTTGTSGEGTELPFGKTPRLTWGGWPDGPKWYQIVDANHLEFQLRDVPDGEGWRVPVSNQLYVSAAAGWPMLCLWKYQGEFKPLCGAIRLPDSAGRHQHFPGQNFRGLPLLPVWSGLAVNTCLYGGLCFVVFAARQTWSCRWRRRRGACPACAYDLSGSNHAVCPECGSANWPRSTPLLGTPPLRGGPHGASDAAPPGTGELPEPRL